MDGRRVFHRNVTLTFVAVVLMLMQLSCTNRGSTTAVPMDAKQGKIETGISTETPQPTETVAPTDPPPPTATAMPKDDPAESSPSEGMVCAVLYGLGVTCLDEAGWHNYTREGGHISDTYISSVATCNEEHPLLFSAGNIVVFDGQTWDKFDGPGEKSGSLACDMEGGIWLAHLGGASYFDGATWTTYPIHLFFTGDVPTTLVPDVAVASDGQVWVLTGNSIASFNGDAWTVFQEGQGLDKVYFFQELALDSQDRPWVVHSEGVLSYEGDTWIPHEIPGIWDAQNLTVDLEDRVWVGTKDNGLLVLEKSGEWSEINRTTGGPLCNSINNITTDAQGRIWVGGEWGLHIFDGAKWHTYSMANAPLLGNDIAAVAVIGEGPELPEPLEREPGSMRGRILIGDAEPLEGAAVEICVQGIFTYEGATPCSEQPFMRRTQTDAEGRFVFSDVPPGFYVLAVEVDDNWNRLAGQFGGSEYIPVEEGQETDLQTLLVRIEN